MNREIHRAIPVLEEFPVSQVYLIPVRLEPCEPILPSLRSIQWVDIFEDWAKGLKKLIGVIGLEFNLGTPEPKGALLNEIHFCPKCGNDPLSFEYITHSGDNDPYLY